uniref:Uncharacterized protein n=1 Tax=Setaria viridis TaxID=4556 RepID=A0A4U6TK79_SETVI|nr:hypothetical protein SEVIR_7G030600v2 [Setaria viridis]
MAVIDPEVGDVAVNMVPERVPSTDTGVAPELTAATPSDIMPPIADQAVLGLPAGAAGTVKEVSLVLATGTLLSNVIASGATLGTVPHLVESTQRAVPSLPSDLEFQRAIDVFRGFQERSHQLEQECARLTEALRVHEVGAKSFAVERVGHAVLQEKLESRYKSLNKKYQELKKQEAAARSQVIDWRNAHDRVADEAEHLRVALTEARAACEHQRDRKMQNGMMLAMAMLPRVK